MKHNFPKVLICAPTYDGKNYTLKQWAERVKRLSYPNYEVFLADNSETDDNSKMLEQLGFTSLFVPKNKKGNEFTLRDSHNACRDYFLSGDFQFMLHLETDVIPPIDVIERLLHGKRQIIGGTYEIQHGFERKAMVQTDEALSKFKHNDRAITYLNNLEPLFFDGTIKEVYHCGLGCLLIHRDVIEMIEFEAIDVHPDTLFAQRCYENNLPIFIDTQIVCEHNNQNWMSIN